MTNNENLNQIFGENLTPIERARKAYPNDPVQQEAYLNWLSKEKDND